MNENELIDSNTEYSPAQIVEWFDVPRPTLFRWEANKEIPKPDINEHGERVYRDAHVRGIYKRIRVQIKREIRLIYSSDSKTVKPNLERLYKAKFFGGSTEEKKIALRELEGLADSEGVSDATLRTIFHYSLSLKRDHPVRRIVAELIVKNSILNKSD